jgi:hypothetical protein
MQIASRLIVARWLRPFLASFVLRFAIGLCRVYVFSMLGISKTLVRTTTHIIITATVSTLFRCSIEMIRSLTLPSFHGVQGGC